MSTKDIDEFGIDWDFEAERCAAVVKEGFTDSSFFNYFKDLIKDNSVILELGCNIGNWYPTWRDLGKKLGIKINYIGVDFSPRAIEISRDRYKDVNAQFIYMNIKDIDYNEEIDVVFTHTCLQHVGIETKRIMAPKILKALKSDGLLIIQENTATVSDATWSTVKGWTDFFEGYGFKNIRNHDIGSGGTAMIFKKVDIGNIGE